MRYEKCKAEPNKKRNNRKEQEDEISVLLVEEQPKSNSILKKALKDFNYQVTRHLSFKDDIVAQLEIFNPNILILETDLPSEETLKKLAAVSKFMPLPIIIFAENESPYVIKQAIKAGVSAYVVHEILPQRIKSVIAVARERFKQVQSLRNELQQTKTQLESRKLIERAKGLLMEQKKITENQAYDTLRKMAMNQGNSLAMVAKNIVDVCDLLQPSNT